MGACALELCIVTAFRQRTRDHRRMVIMLQACGTSPDAGRILARRPRSESSRVFRGGCAAGSRTMASCPRRFAKLLARDGAMGQAVRRRGRDHAFLSSSDSATGFFGITFWACPSATAKPPWSAAAPSWPCHATLPMPVYSALTSVKEVVARHQKDGQRDDGRHPLPRGCVVALLVVVVLLPPVGVLLVSILPLRRPPHACGA